MEKSFKCPFCRQKNIFNDINSFKIYSKCDNCEICMEDKITTYKFPHCTHKCCFPCIEKLYKIITEPNFNPEENIDERPDWAFYYNPSYGWVDSYPR
jgi:hypothetical protein